MKNLRRLAIVDLCVLCAAALTMDLQPEMIIKETDCALGVEVGRGAFGAVSLAVLKGSVQACAKVRARFVCMLRLLHYFVYVLGWCRSSTPV